MVRIMSIHKSKGLEFPVVFLAGMGKKFNQRDAYGTLLLDAGHGGGGRLVDLKLRTKTPTLKKQVLKRRLELETMGEELRILYVAMTRAKEELIMTGTDRSLSSSWSAGEPEGRREDSFHSLFYPEQVPIWTGFLWQPVQCRRNILK